MSGPVVPASPLLQMPIRQAIWSLARPTIALGILRSSYFLANSFWISKMGEKGLAAIGGCAFATWITYALMDIAATGVYSQVAQATGAGDRGRVRNILGQGLVLASVVGVLISLLIFTGTDQYLTLLGVQDAEVRRLSLEYMHYMAWSAVPLTWFNTLTSAFRGLGNARAPLWMYGFTLVFNAVVDPFLISGFGGWSGMGISGAAMATLLAHLLGIAASLSLLRSEQAWPTLQTFKASALLPLASIGTPIAVSGAGFSLVYVLLGQVINRFGPEAMAAVGLGHRLESTVFLVTIGFQVATTTLVGQWIGAGSPQEALNASRQVRREMIRVVLPVGLVLMGVAPWVIRLFSTEPAVVHLGSWYLYLTGGTAVLMGLEVIYEGAFSGVGRTLAPLLIAFPLTLARVPLAWFLAVNMELGAVGVWWAIATSTILKGLLMMGWFERQGWMKGAPVSQAAQQDPRND